MASDPVSDPSPLPSEILKTLKMYRGLLIASGGNNLPPNGNAPLDIRAHENTAIGIYADSDDGTGAGNINWYDSEGNYIASLTGHDETHQADDVSEMALYASPWNVGENSNQAKVLDIGVGSESYGENQFSHTALLALQNPRADEYGPNGIGGDTTFSIEPGNDQNGNEGAGSILFTKPNDVLNWRIIFNENGNGVLKFQNLTTGGTPLKFHPDGWRAPTFPNGTDSTGAGGTGIFTDGDRTTGYTFQTGEFLQLEPEGEPCEYVRVCLGEDTAGKEVMLTPRDGTRDVIDRVTSHGYSDNPKYMMDTHRTGKIINLGNFSGETVTVNQIEVL